jgi:aminoglycoside phosphotransferase
VLAEAAGRLGTRIQHLELPDGRRAYLKIAPRGGPEDLGLERDRLGWLAHRLPVPEVLGFDAGEDVERLLVSELPGTAAHLTEAVPRATVLGVVADALRRIQAVDVASCPFRATTCDEIAEARAMVARGAIDEPGFLAVTGLSPAAALARITALVAARPPRDAVWSHGDFCLPNVLIDGHRLGGILDWGLARVADPARDLAMLEGSLRHNLGEASVSEFYAIWGARPPREQVEMFDLLDELFTRVRPTAVGEASP